MKKITAILCVGMIICSTAAPAFAWWQWVEAGISLVQLGYNYFVGDKIKALNQELEAQIQARNREITNRNWLLFFLAVGIVYLGYRHYKVITERQEESRRDDEYTRS